MNDAPDRRAGTSRDVPAWAAAAAVAVVVLVLWGQTRHFGLLGFDSYPLIGASRVVGATDLLDNFTEPLMAGRYPSRLTPQGFPLYRPLLNLTFALDYALWGLSPAGYQATNLLWFAGCALALFGLARRVAGPGTWIAPLLALGIFLLHPAQFEVLPVPPRRAETMCALFMALALMFQFPREQRRRPSAAVASILAALAALASKETAFVLPGLVLVAAWIHTVRSTTSTVWGALGGALLKTLPHVGLVAVMLAIRGAAVGLGGGGGVVRDLFAKAPGTVWVIVRGVLFPQNDPLAGWWSAAVLAGLAVLGIVAATRFTGGLGRTSVSGSVGLGVLGGAWVSTTCLIYAAADSLQPWYFLIPVAGWALVLGAVFQAVARVALRGSGVLRAAALATILATLVFVSVQLRYSPVVHRYHQPLLATELGDRFLSETRRRLEAAPAGTVVEAPWMPIWVSPAAEGPTLRGAAVLSDYSIKAWAELTFPERNISVRVGPAGEAPRADETVLAITRSGAFPSESR